MKLLDLLYTPETEEQNYDITNYQEKYKLDPVLDNLSDDNKELLTYILFVMKNPNLMNIIALYQYYENPDNEYDILTQYNSNMIFVINDMFYHDIDKYSRSIDLCINIFKIIINHLKKACNTCLLRQFKGFVGGRYEDHRKSRIKILLDYGSDISIKDKNSNTVLDYAKNYGYHDFIVEYDKQVNPDPKDPGHD